MKIANYSINLASNYQSDTVDNILRTTKIGSDSLTKIQKIDKNQQENIESSDSQELVSADFKKTGMDSDILLTAKSQSSSFAAKGLVQTSGGASISFELDSVIESKNISISIRPKHDPLVVSSGGSMPEFLDKNIKFDINADGKMDEIAALKQGSYYLAIDKNHNGKIDDGSELIGAQNGGFEELGALDSDKNGFVDENDSAYKDIKVWYKGLDTESLQSLKDAHIGALFTGSVKNDYEYILNGDTKAYMHANSIALTEDGKALNISQVDLTFSEVAKDEQNLDDSKSVQSNDQQSEGGKWVATNKTEENNTQNNKNDKYGFIGSIKTQISQLEKEYDKISKQALYAKDEEEAKFLNTRAGLVKSQISILKASLFKLEKHSINENA